MNNSIEVEDSKIFDGDMSSIYGDQDLSAITHAEKRTINRLASDRRKTAEFGSLNFQSHNDNDNDISQSLNNLVEIKRNRILTVTEENEQSEQNLQSDMGILTLMNQTLSSSPINFEKESKFVKEKPKPPRQILISTEDSFFENKPLVPALNQEKKMNTCIAKRSSLDFDNDLDAKMSEMSTPNFKFVDMQGNEEYSENRRSEEQRYRTSEHMDRSPKAN